MGRRALTAGMEMQPLIEQCAQLIHDARRVVFLTSAGMSADSNIPTFRDKEGYWSNFPQGELIFGVTRGKLF